VNTKIDRAYQLTCLLSVVALCFVPPIYLLATTLGQLEGPVWQGLFTAREMKMLGRTLGMASVAVVVAGLLGLGYAAAQHHARRGLRTLLALGAPVALLMPPYLMATAWARLLGLPAPSIVYGWPGTGVVLGFCFFPLVALPVGVALRSTGGASADAARLLLPRRRDRLRIALGALRPHLLGGMALVFPLAAANLAAPMILRTNVYSLEVFTQFSANYDIPRAVLSALPLTLLALLVLGARQWLLTGAPRQLLDGRWRPDRARGSHAAGIGGLAILGVTVVTPVLSLVRDVTGLPQFEQSLTTAGDEVFVSLQVSALAAVIMVLIGAGYGRLLAGRRRGVQMLLGGIGLIPLVLPGAIIGLGLVVMTRDGLLPRFVYDTPVILALAAAARYLPFAVLLAWAAEERVGPRYVEAAWLCGLPRLTRVLRIKLPLIAPELLAALAFSFAFAMGELAAAVLVAPPGVTTLAVRLASLLHFGEDGIVSSLCLVLAFLVLLVMGIVSLVANRILELRFDAAR